MLLETVRSALQRRGYDVTEPEPTSANGDTPRRWRSPDVVAEGDDDVLCWVVDTIDPTNVLRAQAAAREAAARPMLCADDVRDDARPWAERYDVEVLDPAALEAAGPGHGDSTGANGNGAHGNGAAGSSTNGDASDGDAEVAGDAHRTQAPDEPVLGAAPGTDGGDDGPEPRDEPDVVDVLDLPSPLEGPTPDADPTAETDDPEPAAPPTWLGARPDRTAASAGRPAQGDGPDPGDPGARRGDASPPPPVRAGTGQVPAGTEEDPSEPEADTADPTEVPSASSPPADDGGVDAGDLPWEPADADPPDPDPVEGDAAVNPPGTPLEEGAEAAPNGNGHHASNGANGNGADEAGPVAPGASVAEGGVPDPGPGGTSLDALVEAASQSPHPNVDVPAEGDGGADDPTQEPGGPTPSAGTRDVMREVEAESAGADPDGGASGTPAETGAPSAAADHVVVPDRGNGPGGAGPEPGDGSEDADGVEPVGTDDAAMRRHDPGLWGTTGRIDDVRTSLRDDGDSPHARARGDDAASGWLSDLDGEG